VLDLPRIDLLAVAYQAVDGGDRVEQEAGSAPQSRVVEPLPRLEEIYAALTLGLRDYVLKNNFQRVLMDLWGGIESVLTACIAADALEPENVVGVAKPSRHSADFS
jgi:NAD+ synthase (glutamine-hydrolysing)